MNFLIQKIKTHHALDNSKYVSNVTCKLQVFLLGPPREFTDMHLKHEYICSISLSDFHFLLFDPFAGEDILLSSPYSSLIKN